MGGLFSSGNNASQAKSNSYDEYQIPQYRNTNLHTSSRTINEYWQRENTWIRSSTYERPEPTVYIKRKYNPNYMPSYSRVILNPESEYKLLPIDCFDYEYNIIKRRITNKHFKVHSIYKIEAPCLETSYRLKKRQKLKKFPSLEELELFHGTKSENASKICLNNFNWRFNGKGTGHRFGKGVSFSCNAMYAANYSTDDGEKVMFIAKVMIGKRCQGRSDMELPDEGCDTSTKQMDDIVVVKYEDNEFYPIYKIHYHIAPGYVPMNKRKQVRPVIYFD